MIRSIKRIWLFATIVWRRWDQLPNGDTIRLDWSTAWKVVHVVYPNKQDG